MFGLNLDSRGRRLFNDL